MIRITLAEIEENWENIIKYDRAFRIVLVAALGRSIIPTTTTSRDDRPITST